MKLLLFVTLIFSFVYLTFGDACEKKLVKADNLTKGLLFIGEKVAFPKTLEQLRKYCEDTKKTFGAIREYRSCLTGFSRQVLTVFLHGVLKAYKNNCGKKAKSEEILYQIRCYNERTALLSYECIDHMTNQMKYISKNVTYEKIFPNLCCSIHKLNNCLYNRVIADCGEGNVDGAEYLRSLFGVALNDVLNLGCAKQPTEEVCNKTLKKEITILNKVAKNKITDRATSFVLRPLLQVTSKLIE